MQSEDKKYLLLDSTATKAAITKVAEAIIEEFPPEELREIAFLGLQLRGVPLSLRLAEIIHKKTSSKPLLGTIDISMYRDDIGLRKTIQAVRETQIPFEVSERKIILVDDVLYTGRTIRAALDAITDYGRPELIRLAVLIDRGFREFPIRADYVGDTCDVPKEKKVVVSLNEVDGEDAVYEKIKAATPEQ